METKTKNSNTISTNKTKTPRPAPAPFTASEKVQAVLAVWTERCRPMDVCREMKIPPMTFSQWQQRAMEGMLQALESRVNLAKGEVLSPRLRSLLFKRQTRINTHKLSQRLEQIQLAKAQENQNKTE